MKIDQTSPTSKIRSSGIGLFGLVVILAFLITAVAVMGNTNKPAGLSSSASADVTSSLTIQPTSTGKVVTEIQPPATCGYCESSLVGKTTDEIGQFAVQFAQSNNYVLNGTPQVVVSRSIDADQFMNLGLGCLTNLTSIEQPPLALVMMSGHFNFNKGLSSSIGVYEDPKLTSYLTLVFDLWSGVPTDWRLTTETAGLNTLLNKTAATPYPCLARTPADQRTLHYGEALPGSTVAPQTAVAVETKVAEPSNQAALPTPVPTAAAPLDKPSE